MTKIKYITIAQFYLHAFPCVISNVPSPALPPMGAGLMKSLGQADIPCMVTRLVSPTSLGIHHLCYQTSRENKQGQIHKQKPP